jgi:Zn-dependent protease
MRVGYEGLQRVEVNKPTEDESSWGRFKSLIKSNYTILSLVVSFILYGITYSWTFAVGLLSILLLHEYGHIWAAKAHKIRTTAPIFLPYLGALIEMKERPKNVVDEGWLAAGGPIAGLSATAVYWIAGTIFHSPTLNAIALFGFMIHLFNMIPLSPLDGGRMMWVVTPYLWFVVAPVILYNAFRGDFTIGFLLVFFGWVHLPRKLDPNYFKVPFLKRLMIASLYLGMLTFCFVGASWILLNTPGVNEAMNVLMDITPKVTDVAKNTSWMSPTWAVVCTAVAYLAGVKFYLKQR